jgi:hypothetical protein
MSITLERKVDHLEEALDRPIDQYRHKTRFEGWLGAYIKQVQIFEDAAWQVIIRRFIDTARAAQLDMIGKIVGEYRQGRGDDQYRVFIRARITINRSQGQANDILNVLALITATPFIFDEYYPASMLLEFVELPEHDPELIFALLHDAKAGGVRLNMIAPGIELDTDTSFLWSAVADPVVASTFGFSDVAEPAAPVGLLSDLIVAPR